LFGSAVSDLIAQHESFGFDTIRLKENNTRINSDTSTSTGFPNHDWQLTANDPRAVAPTSFRLKTLPQRLFTITGSAPNQSIFV